MDETKWERAREYKKVEEEDKKIDLFLCSEKKLQFMLMLVTYTHAGHSHISVACVNVNPVRGVCEPTVRHARPVRLDNVLTRYKLIQTPLLHYYMKTNNKILFLICFTSSCAASLFLSCTQHRRVSIVFFLKLCIHYIEKLLGVVYGANRFGREMRKKDEEGTRKREVEQENTEASVQSRQIRVFFVALYMYSIHDVDADQKIL